MLSGGVCIEMHTAVEPVEVESAVADLQTDWKLAGPGQTGPFYDLDGCKSILHTRKKFKSELEKAGTRKFIFQLRGDFKNEVRALTNEDDVNSSVSAREINLESD